MVLEGETLHARLKLGFHPKGSRDQPLVFSELGCGRVCSARVALAELRKWMESGAWRQGSPCDYAYARQP